MKKKKKKLEITQPSDIFTSQDINNAHGIVIKEKRQRKDIHVTVETGRFGGKRHIRAHEKHVPTQVVYNLENEMHDWQREKASMPVFGGIVVEDRKEKE